MKERVDRWRGTSGFWVIVMGASFGLAVTIFLVFGSTWWPAVPAVLLLAVTLISCLCFMYLTEKGL